MRMEPEKCSRCLLMGVHDGCEYAIVFFIELNLLNISAKQKLSSCLKYIEKHLLCIFSTFTVLYLQIGNNHASIKT